MSHCLTWILLASTALFGCVQHCFADEDEWPEWGYEEDNGPSRWAHSFPDCEGTRQSPINIKTDEVTRMDVGRLTVSGYDKTSEHEMELKNNGHTVVLEVKSGPAMTMSGGNLPGTYILAGFHFHWGDNDNVGSEHTIDDKAYPLEVHLVHYKNEYDIYSAANHSDGYAVLGFFAQIGDKPNAGLDKLLSAFANVTYNGQKTPIKSFAVQSILPSNIEDFFRYDGSLTTPHCKESVVWTVNKKPITITSQQMEKFRALKRNKPSGTVAVLANNYRPAQPLNKRTVYLMHGSAPSHNGQLITIAVAALIWALTARY